MPISPHLEELRSLIGTRLLQVPLVAAIIADDRGRILLLRGTANGRWSLPAGAIDPGETPEDPVRREVREETGLVVVPSMLCGVFSGREFRHTYENGDIVEYMVAVYRCDVIGGSLGGDRSETHELRYVDRDELPVLVPPYPSDLFAVN